MSDGTAGGIWQPSEAALKTARSVVTELDIPLHIARYVVVKAEKHQDPTSSEWLKWIIADEQKAKTEARQQARAAAKQDSWYTVAD